MIELRGKNILITGGSGFIGSNLCDSLVEQNKIVCLDNLSTGNFNNIKHLISHPNFTFKQEDIRDFDACLQATQNIDIVFHQAALGSVSRSVKDPRTTNEVNISGFLNVLEASKQQSVDRFIYAASSSTYGDSQDLPKREDKIGKPLSPYAVTKYVNELYADVYFKLYGIKTIGLRYFNVFGKRQSPNGEYAAAIPRFIHSLLEGKSPIVFGNGEQSRDFTYIKNVIQANHLAAVTQNTNAFNQVYNIAYGESNTLNILISFLKELVSEKKSNVQHISVSYEPERLGDIKHSLATIDKAKMLLGYHPMYDLREGLREAIDWYIENL